MGHLMRRSGEGIRTDDTTKATAMKMKVVIYTVLVFFILYSLYMVVMIYVLNIISLKSSYIYHSKSAEISKQKGLYAGSYTLKQQIGDNVNLEFLPKNLFIEKEKVIYPNYYFYFGKSEMGNRYTINGTIFSQLAKDREYLITCSTSTQPGEINTTQQSNLFFFFENLPPEIHFTIKGHLPKTSTDTLIYRLNNP